MKRYRIVNGVPVLPPQSAVTVTGRVLSNFAGRVACDAAFAAAHGYYPLKEEATGVMPESDLLEEDLREAAATAVYTLIGGAWVRTVK